MPAVRCLFLTGLSLLVLLVGAPAWALDPARKVDEYTISRWTMEDGLSHNLVHAIQQDADGYLWTGTWEGAARFNGRTFEIHTGLDDATLPDPGLRALRVLRSGELVAGGSRGGLASRTAKTAVERKDAFRTAFISGPPGAPAPRW